LPFFSAHCRMTNVSSPLGRGRSDKTGAGRTVMVHRGSSLAHRGFKTGGVRRFRGAPLRTSWAKLHARALLVFRASVFHLGLALPQTVPTASAQAPSPRDEMGKASGDNQLPWRSASGGVFGHPPSRTGRCSSDHGKETSGTPAPASPRVSSRGASPGPCARARPGRHPPGAEDGDFHPPGRRGVYNGRCGDRG